VQRRASARSVSENGGWAQQCRESRKEKLMRETEELLGEGMWRADACLRVLDEMRDNTDKSWRRRPASQRCVEDEAGNSRASDVRSLP